ncbi:fumarylacetoacetate hydrolase family protein [Pannonibacter indicus]|uniref:2-keto-4-pentenoate hydratase/2-oxohepta-3-ene-1,7-dioic acid hydratase (Catechol pathway) n=1 Tax=Pannonibacter indicus TaxID=466044 RepID=A0A0K6HMT1_9HYPH|nr:fumarylacetoacetate hydrolase family protein [Pannonibacter indicus]CUA92225.1 2-keto-4-pentenoate hydratase/2-oxohepta-3-ene-1,7-dioic acid hydratase (catechol pathway) [Pannonibacter indicus]
MTSFVIDVPKIPALPVAGTDALFPVRRVYCIGRNYAAHAVEMGHDPSKEPPFFFQKNPDNLDASGTFPYPGQTADVHHEVELAVVLKSGGSGIAVADALFHVYGYAVALDMTRRDLQAVAKDMGRPWDTAKAFEHSAPIGPVIPASICGHPQAGAITLTVNGTLRQSGDLNQMIWKIPEMIAYLSDYFTLAAGDVILTGTPSGVGPVVRGDRLEARVEGFAPLTVEVV